MRPMEPLSPWAASRLAAAADCGVPDSHAPRSGRGLEAAHDDRLEVEIANQQQLLPIDADQLAEAVRIVLAGEGIRRASLSVAVVDDTTIWALNRRYLSHDYPTDVLAFPLSDPPEPLEGEVIVSAETAQRAAPQHGWSAERELLLYVVHGTLHLCGHDDHDPAGRQVMRDRQTAYLTRLAGGAAGSADGQGDGP